MFEQLTSFAEPTLDVYAAFYGGRLLLAPDADALAHYIRQLDKGEVLNGAMAYQTGMDHLSDSYHFMLMADFDHIFQQSEKATPTSFSLPGENGVVYPNIVLKYKSE